jgi:hypothetical protein
MLSANPSTKLVNQAAPQANELVLLIHGTFANNEEDIGKSWWQQDSTAWRQLGRRLPGNVRLPEGRETFHWSGENSERARIKAGHDLLEELLKLEEADRGYHLIGHSHGGSVIWHALREATLRRIKLNRLRSWSTVGTPFLHCRTHGALSLANIAYLVLGLVLLKPATNAFLSFFLFAWAAVVGNNVTLDIRSDQEVGLLMAVSRAPILKTVAWAGVPVRATETGLRLGSYDPATGQSLFEYLFGTPEGWVITLIVLVGGYVFLLLASLCLNPVLESLRLRLEKRLERTAMETYRGRWLGLWSTSDEAINGLRATLDLTVSFVSRMVRRDQVLWSDYILILARPYAWAVSPIFNEIIRPLLDRTVQSLVIKAAQGNNRPAAQVVAVSPFPALDLKPDAHPPLPPDLDASLVEQANQHARDIGSKLRNLLAAPSFVAGMERFGTSLAGQELIHTSYFDHPAILQLLAFNIAWGRRDASAIQHMAEEDCELWNWFRKFKRSVAETALLEIEPETEPRLIPIKPRRSQYALTVHRSAA